MPAYQIGDHEVHDADPLAPKVLAHAYAAKVRPFCLCKAPPVPMYIAAWEGRHLIKRMPGTGDLHAATCDSYEPPPELSGLGQVAGTAIRDDPATPGITTLRLDFALSKSPGKAPPATSAAVHDTVKSDGSRLTLRGTLHYLWDEAGFTKWSPAMAGKRSWFIIRKYLLQAAEGKTVKGASLSDLLFIPEEFSAEHKSEIARRRTAVFAKAAAPEKGPRPLLMGIAEVKDMGAARYGSKLTFKHLADCPFMLADDIYKRMVKRFEVEIGLWTAFEDCHLMAIFVFGVGATGIPTVEALALMLVNEGWLPFESLPEKALIDALAFDHRRFTKCMRYNLSPSRPLANVVVTDSAPQATAMYITSADVSESYATARDELISDSKLAHWLWSPADGDMPALPHKYNVSRESAHTHTAHT